VESYHTTNGPRQRAIMQLGRIDLPRKKWPVLGKALEDRLAAVPMQEQLSFIADNKTKQALELANKIRVLADKAINDYHSLKSHTSTALTESQVYPRSTKCDHGPSGNPVIASEKGALLKLVDCNSLTTTCSRSFGPELVGHHVWRQLRFPEVLKKCGLKAREMSLSGRSSSGVW